MAIKNIEFIQIEAVLDSLGRKQIGVEPDVDSELNFRMWGGKDSTGALTHWLAKNKPGLLHSLRLSSLAGQSQSIAKIDTNGNIIRGSSQIKDNARDDVTDPIHPDNITDIEQLTFVRNVGADANYTSVTSEERTYGVLIPAPALQADQGKVPMYKDGNQIAWENVLNEAPDDGLSYARSSKTWNAIGSSIDITDDFELINGMSTNDVGHYGRFKVIYVPSTDMVQIVGNFFSPTIKPYGSWVPCMKYTGDLLSFNSAAGSQMNVGLGAPPNYLSVRAIMTSAFIPTPEYSDRIFAFKGLMGDNNVTCYGVSAFFTCYGCRAAKLAEIAAAKLANSGE